MIKYGGDEMKKSIMRIINNIEDNAVGRYV